MKKIIFALCFLVFIQAQNKPISLSESIEIGLSNNPEVKIAKTELVKMKEKKWEVTSRMLPKIDLNATYMRMSDVPGFSISLPILPQPVNVFESIPNRYSFGLRLEQPIFTGFRLSSLRNAAEHQKSAAEFSLEKTINDEKLNITKAYWNFSKTQNIVKLLNEKLRAMEIHLKNTKSFVENGLATKNDLLRIELQQSNLRLLLTEADNARKISQSVFNKALGIDILEDTKIEAVTSVYYADIKREDSLIDGYVINRFEILLLDQNINAANEIISSEKAGYYPNIFAFGDYYYSRPNQQIFPLKDEFKDTWDVGIGLKWTLWDWGQTSSKSSQAEYQADQLKERRKDLYTKLKIDIYSKYLNVKKQIEQKEITALSFSSALENLRIIKQKYEAHLVTSADLIDAENLLLEAETSMANAVADLCIAIAEYENVTGKDLIIK